MTRKETTIFTLHNKKAAGALIVIATAYRCQSASAAGCEVSPQPAP